MFISKSRVKSASRAPLQPAKDEGGSGSGAAGGGARRAPDLEHFLERRDYVGAITLLAARRRAAASTRGSGGGEGGAARAAEWLAYAHFHFGEHDKALRLYEELLAGPDPDPQHHTFAAACLFHMGAYEEAEAAAARGPRGPLQARILFHCAHKRGDEAALMARHQELGEGAEDELSLAAVHFQRGHFQEATDTYKRLLLDHRDYAALNVYVALCYARLDYHDVAQEVLAEYLSAHPTSPAAVNLKACNAFRLADGRAAEAALRALADASPGGGAALREQPLLRHNLCVFRSGQGAQQVFPPLGDLLPEARLNLVTYHLQRGALGEAYGLMRDVAPAAPQEFILKATVLAALGQQEGNAEHLKAAQHLFQVVGSSASECDTIPGRQAMASCFMLQRQFDDVLVFLESIKSYFEGNNDFAWNYGIALAAMGRYAEAEAVLGAIADESYRAEEAYVAWVARCLALTGRAGAAWRLVTEHGAASGGAAAAPVLLRGLADDAYRAGAFLVAAKAFDALERVDPSAAPWEAKQGACVGVFQAVIAGKEHPDALAEAVAMLEAGPPLGAVTSAGAGGRGGAAAAAAALAHQLASMARVMRGWAAENGIDLP